ncbi:DUF2797 domain-containing protein [Streptomyces sp. BI20]|uniref:DUF2797 domain-containing protein n=1 Tax=Streptomyces sp. BI20 TaxID=3403460 RepID=UPI003C789DAF
MDGHDGWWCTGPVWREGRPGIGWWVPGGDERTGAVTRGRPLAFLVHGPRRCLGVWRAGRRTPCPEAAEVPARTARAQCPSCARIDRSFSVAADTHADDPRPYRVYLAWFGPGLLKVGITGEARGAARLLEQGAVTWTWLGRGPLMAGRRTEETLRAALGIPDRIGYGRKRAARWALPPAGERAAEVAALHARALALPGRPESLEPLPCEVVDHADAFGLTGAPAPDRVLTHAPDGLLVAGTPVGVAGPDLHLAEGLVVDLRLLAGLRVSAPPPGPRPAAPGPEPTAALRTDRQEGLF